LVGDGDFRSAVGRTDKFTSIIVGEGGGGRVVGGEGQEVLCASAGEDGVLGGVGGIGRTAVGRCEEERGLWAMRVAAGRGG